jgi:hypothetical protein
MGGVLTKCCCDDDVDAKYGIELATKKAADAIAAGTNSLTGISA